MMCRLSGVAVMPHGPTWVGMRPISARASPRSARPRSITDTSFVPPFAVLNDLRLLDELPPREKIAGMAEAVKVALIRDAAFFGWLERHAGRAV